MNINKLEVVEKLTVKILKKFEGCSLVAYPDVASDLYNALFNNNLLRKYMSGLLKHAALPEHFKNLNGSPWTIGYGNTKNVKAGDTWTLQQAYDDLNAQVSQRVKEVLKDCPELERYSVEQIAATVSLQYNIGEGAFSTSTVRRNIVKGDVKGAADAFLLFNKAKGKILHGLVERRKVERDLFLCVPGG